MDCRESLQEYQEFPVLGLCNRGLVPGMFFRHGTSHQLPIASSMLVSTELKCSKWPLIIYLCREAHFCLLLVSGQKQSWIILNYNENCS